MPDNRQNFFSCYGRVLNIFTVPVAPPNRSSYAKKNRSRIFLLRFAAIVRCIIMFPLLVVGERVVSTANTFNKSVKWFCGMFRSDKRKVTHLWVTGPKHLIDSISKSKKEDEKNWKWWIHNALAILKENFEWRRRAAAATSPCANIRLHAQKNIQQTSIFLKSILVWHGMSSVKTIVWTKGENEIKIGFGKKNRSANRRIECYCLQVDNEYIFKALTFCSEQFYNPSVPYLWIKFRQSHQRCFISFPNHYVRDKKRFKITNRELIIWWLSSENVLFSICWFCSLVNRSLSDIWVLYF